MGFPKGVSAHVMQTVGREGEKAAIIQGLERTLKGMRFDDRAKTITLPTTRPDVFGTRRRTADSWDLLRLYLNQEASGASLEYHEENAHAPSLYWPFPGGERGVWQAVVDSALADYLGRIEEMFGPELPQGD